MTHQQYVTMCQQNPFLSSEDYDGQPYPHPYLEMWLVCQRYRQADGPPVLPDGTRGPLEQDADTMLAFEVLDDLMDERRQEEAARQHNRELARSMGFRM